MAVQALQPRFGLALAVLQRDDAVDVGTQVPFVDLKDRFVQASASLEGANGAWLRAQIRGAEQPEDLMLLRGHLFAALAGADECRRETRRMLRRCIDSLFPDSAPSSGFASF